MQRSHRFWGRLRGGLRSGVRNVRRRRDEDRKDRDDKRLERIYMGAHVTNVTWDGLGTKARRHEGTDTRIHEGEDAVSHTPGHRCSSGIGVFG